MALLLVTASRRELTSWPPPVLSASPWTFPWAQACCRLRAASATPAPSRRIQATGLSLRSISATGFSSGPRFSEGRAVRLFDRLIDFDQRRFRAARIGPDEIADQNEIRTG